MVLNHPIRLIPRAVSDTGFHKGAVHLLVDSLISWGVLAHGINLL